MKLEISSEKAATKQNILMVLCLLNKFHLKLKYFLVHQLVTPNSAFCFYTLLSAPGTIQITFLFSHLATFCALKSMLEEDCTLEKEKRILSHLLSGLSLCQLCLCGHYHSHYSKSSFLWHELNPRRTCSNRRSISLTMLLQR